MDTINIVYSNNNKELPMGISPLTPHIRHAVESMLDNVAEEDRSLTVKQFCVVLGLLAWVDFYYEDETPLFPIKQVKPTASRPSGLLFDMEYNDIVRAWHVIGISGQAALFEGVKQAHPDFIKDLEAKYGSMEPVPHTE